MAQDVSAYSLVSVARAVSPLMTQGGSITTLTYLGATRVIPNYNVMGVAKAALEAAVRYLASDLGPRGIRVNAISAGPVKTVSARAIKDFSSILDFVAGARPAAPEHGPGGGGRRGGLPGQRPGPRRHGERPLRGRGLPDHGHVARGLGAWKPIPQATYHRRIDTPLTASYHEMGASHVGPPALKRVLDYSPRRTT